MQTLTLTRLFTLIFLLNLTFSTSLIANKMGTLNIKFNKPFEAASVHHDLNVVDIITSENNLYILYTNMVGASTSPQIRKYELLNGEFRMLWNFNFNSQTFLNGNLDLDNDELIFRCSVTRILEHNPLFFEVRINKNTGNVISEDRCDSLVFVQKELIQPTEQNILQHENTRVFYQHEILPNVVGSGKINEIDFLILRITGYTLLQLPPFTFSKPSPPPIKLVLVTFTIMNNESFLITSVTGADENPNFSGFKDYHYGISDGRDIRVNYSIYTNQSMNEMSVEVSNDSTFKNTLVLKSENPDTVLFHVKHKMAPGIYYLRLNAKLGSGNIYSDVLTLNVVNNKYSEYKNNRSAYYANWNLIIVSLLGWLFLYSISHFPDLKDYRFNFLSGILSDPKWGKGVDKALWWLLFPTYFIGFFCIKLIPSTWELFKYLRQ